MRRCRKSSEYVCEDLVWLSQIFLIMGVGAHDLGGTVPLDVDNWVCLSLVNIRNSTLNDGFSTKAEGTSARYARYLGQA